jgi:transcriptional regulator with XRE-family HTH domain
MVMPRKAAMPDSPLKTARESAGLSRKELARRMGRGVESISNAELGRPVSLDWLHRAAVAIGCKPSDLDERLTSNRPKR